MLAWLITGLLDVVPGALAAHPFVADTAVVVTERANPILAYAADELCGFLRQTTRLDIRQQETEPNSACWWFHLVVDPEMSPTEFEVTCAAPSGNRLAVKVAGHDAAGVLHAVYTMPDFLRAHGPADIALTLLPAHGARAVVNAVRTAKLSAEDWGRTMLHSWVEFDGLMYLQQNSLVGTWQLLELARSTLTNAQIPAIAFYHWRTAENRTAIRYAALACLDARLDPDRFYVQYAKALGIGSAANYAKAMGDLDELDGFCRDHLFNIGFSFVGCWTGPKGLAWTRGWKKESLEVSQRRFAATERILAECLRNTDTLAGRQYLRFLDNRLRCTLIHLQLIGQLLDLHGVCEDAHPEALNAEGRGLVDERCRSATRLAEAYMQLHSQAIMDRGCEGTLISYFHTISAYINHIREVFLPQSPADEKSAGPSGPPAPGESSRPR